LTASGFFTNGALISTNYPLGLASAGNKKAAGQNVGRLAVIAVG